MFSTEQGDAFDGITRTVVVLSDKNAGGKTSSTTARAAKKEATMVYQNRISNTKTKNSENMWTETNKQISVLPSADMH
jgi:hypothetical protein